jgi:hypothetical protein
MLHKQRHWPSAIGYHWTGCLFCHRDAAAYSLPNVNMIDRDILFRRLAGERAKTRIAPVGIMALALHIKRQVTFERDPRRRQ